MAWTQADVDTLKAAMAKGEKSVTFADRSVVYRDVSEMREALAMIEAEVATTSATPRPRQFFGYASRGL
jgi:hypothetical protein